MRPSRATRGQIFSWTLFDFANTGFYVIIITLVFPDYFSGVIADGEKAYWGRAISASMLITALIGPLLGSIADATSRKKLFLGLFTAACVAATFGMYWTMAGTLTLAVVLLIIANIGFEGGTIFYDAFLPEFSSKENYAKLSGYGYAMGYLGSLITLGILLGMDPGADPTGHTTRLTFIVAAAFFALFSLPLFLFVREEKRAVSASTKELIVDGYRRLRETLSHLRQYDAVKKFLLAFFIYNDAILTVIVFAGIFAAEEKAKGGLGMTFGQKAIFFVIVQISALIGSLVFGKITNRLGPRTTIVTTLVIWIAVVVAAFFVQTPEQFFVIGAVAGIGLGSSQSTSRALMAILTPFEKRTEFFGFYDGFFGKASAVIGPLVFGEVSDWLGQRAAMLVIGGMFAIGIVLMLRVPDVRVEENVPTRG